VTARAGGGFVKYIWPKPGAGDTRKLTYAEMIPGTQMWIGTGVYLDNIEAYKARWPSDIGSMVSKRTTTMVIVAGIIFAAIIALCLFIAFGIVRALKEMIVSFQDIAEGEGDLTKRIEIASKDEIAELAGWFNTFLEKLQAMIGKIADNSTHVDRSSTELSEIASMMSTGAGETSSRADNVSASPPKR
jgi:methyl-accepting chemotaxis protein